MRINYEVELLLPAVTASLGVIGKDIDITIKRDKDGYPIFNAKHIKGISEGTLKKIIASELLKESNRAVYKKMVIKIK